jgi:hypothetical protein
MTDHKATELMKKIGLDRLVVGHPERGVALAWTTALVQSFLPADGWQLLGNTMFPVANGEARREWIWGKGEARLMFEVFVSSAGPGLAHESLVRKTTENMRPDVPHVRGPAELGDVSAVYDLPPTFFHVIWVFRNMCVSLEKRDAPDLELLAIARAIQTRLAQNVVADVGAFVPHIDRIEPSTAAVHLGDTLALKVRMASSDPQRDLLVDIERVDNSIRILSQSSAGIVLEPDAPMARDVMVRVVDPVSLLSAWAPVAITVR